MRAKPFIPPHLEVRTDYGSTFIETSLVIRDPDLQARCVEKRELQRIITILRKKEGTATVRPPRRRFRRVTLK